MRSMISCSQTLVVCSVLSNAAIAV